MDLAIDLRLVLSALLLAVLAGAVWKWLHTAPRTAAADALQTLFAHAPVAVLWLDAAGAPRWANGQARTLLGPDAATALHAHQPESWQAQLQQDIHAVITGPAGSERSRTVAVPEQRTWHWWVTAWQDGALVWIHDVTPAQQAEQATHLLLSDLAHELRTPLATLATHLEVLRLPTVAPEVREQSVEFLRDETQRLVRLVNNTLELGRLQSSSGLERRPVRLFPLVEAVVNQLHNEAQARGVAVSIEAEANLPPIQGNADRLKQVWLNLLDNSLKYARPGDRVTLSLAHGADAGVACAVCDTGPGIAAEHLPYVTRRFYRAVPSGMPGSGLGLALAAEIIRQHGAQLTVESRSAVDVPESSEDPGADGTGTCVRFVLPVWHGEVVT